MIWTEMTAVGQALTTEVVVMCRLLRFEERWRSLSDWCHGAFIFKHALTNVLTVRPLFRMVGSYASLRVLDFTLFIRFKVSVIYILRWLIEG